jgi:hypothetical protein
MLWYMAASRDFRSADVYRSDLSRIILRGYTPPISVPLLFPARIRSADFRLLSEENARVSKNNAFIDIPGSTGFAHFRVRRRFSPDRSAVRGSTFGSFAQYCLQLVSKF